MSVSLLRFQDFFLVLTRTLAILAAVPMLGGRVIPNRVRVGLGVLISMAIIPWSPIPTGDAAEPFASFLLNIGRELMVGVIAALAVRFAFNTIEMAAALMSQSSGFTSGAVLNPTLENSGTAFDQFYTLMAMLIFLSLDGHHQILRAIARTFELVPLRSFALGAATQERLLQLSAGVLLSAVQMALPLMATMLIVEAAFALMVRVAPQINVFFLGEPVKAGLGVVTLSLVLPILLPSLINLFNAMPINLIHLIK